MDWLKIIGGILGAINLFKGVGEQQRATALEGKQAELLESAFIQPWKQYGPRIMPLIVRGLLTNLGRSGTFTPGQEAYGSYLTSGSRRPRPGPPEVIP